MIPADFCSSIGATQSFWQYATQATCSSSNIEFGAGKSLVSKQTIGIVAVTFDLIVTFGFYFALLALKRVQQVQDRDVERALVTASDFSVQVEVDAHLEDVEDLPGVFYDWAENINAKEPDQKCEDPNTKEIDKN